MEETKTSDNGIEVKEIKVKEVKQSPDAKKAFEWLSPIIDSCNQPFHVRCAGILVKQFKEIFYEKYGGKLYYEQLTEKLMDRMHLVEIL